MDQLQKMPRWALIAVAAIGTLAIGAIGTVAGSSLQAAVTANMRQDVTDANHELRIVWLENGQARIEAKLDRLLEIQRQAAH